MAIRRTELQKKKTRKMLPQELPVKQTELTKTQKEKLGEIVRTPEWRNSTPDQKREKIKEVREKY